MARGQANYGERMIVRNRTNRTISLGDRIGYVLRPRERVDLLRWVDRETISQSPELRSLRRNGTISTRWVRPSRASDRALSFVSESDVLSTTQIEPFTFKSLLDYPIVGPTRSIWRDGSVGAVTTGANMEKHLLYLGAGNSGVVRHIWLTFGLVFTYAFASPAYVVQWESGSPSPGPEDLDSYRLRIYTDCGNVADLENPPASSLAVDIPFSAILGAYFSPAPTSSFEYNTDYLDVWLTHDAVPDGGFGVSVKYPIPFSNGILIQQGYLDVGGDWVPLGESDHTIYYYVTYEQGSLPSHLSDFRLKSESWSGSNSEANPAIFMNEPSGRGMAAFLWMSADGTSGWLENNWTFRTDGSGDDVWQTAGGEDLFGVKGILYFTAGEFYNREAGCLYKGSGSEREAYFNFQHSPVYWSDGGLGMFPVSSGNEEIDEGYITFLYYQE